MPHWQRLHAVFRNHHLGKRLPSPDGADTGELLNDQPQGVLIGDHCWIGQGATFTKNAIIPANTVVGLQSVVTKSFREEFTALAGNPAKVIKKGVKWSREREMG